MSYTEFDFPHTHYYDTDLRELICKVSKILKKVEELDDWKDKHEEEYKQLEKLYEDLLNGNFPPDFISALNSYIENYGEDIILKLIKMVFFGLTTDGYFVAYIPESWEDIIFGTSGLDDFPEGIDFGHLTLSY